MRAQARRIVLAALLIGAAGDQLLRGGEGRLGFALLILLIVASALVTGGKGAAERTLVLAGIAFASLGLVLRDSEMLQPIDLLSVLCMGALAVWQGSGGRFARFEVLDAPKAALLAVLTSIAGAPEVLRATGSPEADTVARAARTRSLALGIILAVPPLLIVLLLLQSADVVFGNFVANAVELLSVDGVQHLIVIAALSWCATGWLQGTISGSAVVRLPEARSPGVAFATTAIGLYGLVVLLTLFLGTQVGVLFGGAEYLASTAGLTVAEYAREGFFQLVVVAGIVLATLVAADWLLVREDDALRRFRTVGAMLVLLVTALLVSAVARMWLYLRYFGLSVDRVFALAVMCWVLAALAVFTLTVLRGRTDRLAPLLLTATIVWVTLLNAVNPEGLVVRVNVARAEQGKPFDAAYHSLLSADALPALLAAAPRLPAATCRDLMQRLEKTWDVRLALRSDWRARSLPLARARAWAAERNGSGALTACAEGG